MAGAALQAREEARGTVVAGRLRVADTHWTRLRGLLGASPLGPGEGLWIRPCRQVHTIGMRYPIDVAFLDHERRIVHAMESLAPGRVSPKVAAAASVIELPAGTLARTGVGAGTRLAIEGAPPDVPRESALGAIACNVGLAALYATFLTAHVAAARDTGRWATVLPIVVQEALLVVLFLTRRQTIATSRAPRDWAAGIAGTVLPLLMRTADPPGVLAPAGVVAQVLGLGLAVVGLATLGRSIGIVAANRGLTARGPYGIVRHPMYAAYALSYVGYAATYPTIRNGAILAAALAALFARAVAEERFLSADAAYRAYLARVRWRFLPGVC